MTTRKPSRTVNFSINLPEKISAKNRYFGLSIRIEKNGELLMMSNQITPLNKDSSDRLSLRVNSL